MIAEVIQSARVSSNGRKLFSSDQKVYIVNAWETSGLTAPEFCRRYGLFATQLYKWRKDSDRGAIMGVRNNGELHTKTEVEALYRENEELKKALGEATLDIKILKKKLVMDEQRSQKSNPSLKNLR